MKYPTRCRILDVVGHTIGPYKIKTPDKSKPFIGCEGVAEIIPDIDLIGYRIKITLDNGNYIYGDECWFEPV